MKNKKNTQYYKSRKRVLKYRKQDIDKVVAAIRIATEFMMSAIQLQIALSQPKRKFESGGVSGIVGETGKEQIITAS